MIDARDRLVWRRSFSISTNWLQNVVTGELTCITSDARSTPRPSRRRRYASERVPLWSTACALGSNACTFASSGPQRKSLSLQMSLQAEVESLKCALETAGEVLRLKQLDLNQATWQVKLHSATDIFMQAMRTCTVALRWSPGH